MNAYDFDGDPDGEDVGAVFADSEWDDTPTCDACMEPIEELEPCGRTNDWGKEGICVPSA